ncbi:hypothetical protein [Paenibacillus sp. B01]|uniref:hypothetical protein n=1 Tax=Paenibacillus sp. B01 TaxID=2660554 RepID=UPI001E4C75B4|nr:hypothetical protein [Paenibacillus sp. B01]
MLQLDSGSESQNQGTFLPWIGSIGPGSRNQGTFLPWIGSIGPESQNQGTFLPWIGSIGPGSRNQGTFLPWIGSIGPGSRNQGTFLPWIGPIGPESLNQGPFLPWIGNYRLQLAPKAFLYLNRVEERFFSSENPSRRFQEAGDSFSESVFPRFYNAAGTRWRIVSSLYESDDIFFYLHNILTKGKQIFLIVGEASPNRPARPTIRQRRWTTFHEHLTC